MVTNQQEFNYQSKKLDEDKLRAAALKKIQKSINELNISFTDLKFAA